MAVGYVESWQGVTEPGQGRDSGLKSRINLKIGKSMVCPWAMGSGPMEAQLHRHSMGLGNQPPATEV